MINIVIAYLIVYWLYIKIMGEINKEFTIEAKAKLIILEIDIIDRINEINKSDKINKHKEIILL